MIFFFSAEKKILEDLLEPATDILSRERWTGKAYPVKPKGRESWRVPAEEKFGARKQILRLPTVRLLRNIARTYCTYMQRCICLRSIQQPLHACHLTHPDLPAAAQGLVGGGSGSGKATAATRRGRLCHKVSEVSRAHAREMAPGDVQLCEFRDSQSQWWILEENEGGSKLMVWRKSHYHSVF